MINVPVSVGELFDKISILKIKRDRIKDSGKLANIEKELSLLSEIAASVNVDEKDTGALFSVNEKLWEIEDAIRECEATGDFGPRFIELARSVYQNNDERAKIKRIINEKAGSDLFEEKSYKN